MKYETFLNTREGLLKGNYTLPEVVQFYISQIEKLNPKVNAFTQVFKEDALKSAGEIQKKIDNGTAGLLAGAVIGIKEVIVQKGKLATCASKYLENFESVYDAAIVEKLIANDAIIIGRTNMDEFAMGSSNENSIHGVVRNPINNSKVPGGSSGGSAAALAAKMCNITFGSDTGGSIRQPASFCGVVGLKPTYGRVSRYGLVAFASSLDCIGPFAHSVEDVAEILHIIAGNDSRDATTGHVSVPDYRNEIENPSTNIRIGLPDEYFQEGLDPDVEKKIMSIVDKLEKNGAAIKRVSLPHSIFSIGTYYILATAEASSNLARFDGIRYGHRADIKEVKANLNEQTNGIKEKAKKEGWTQQQLDIEVKKIDSPLIALYKQSRTEGFGLEVKRRIMLGTYVLSAGYYDAYYGKAQRIRRLIKEDFDKAFENVDVILSPTAPTTAFDIGSKLDNPVQMYLNDIYTISANLAGICGISLPVGIDSNGLPIGLQLMANTFEETKLLNAAKVVENLTNAS